MSSLKVEIEAKAMPSAKVEQPILVLNNSIPLGGSEGQVLTKKSNEPYDVEWKEPQGVGGDGGLTEEQVREIVQETAVTKEEDPTVPDWAKQKEKPTYSYSELTGKPTIPSIEGLATEEYVDKETGKALDEAKAYADKKISENELTKVVDALPETPAAEDKNKLFLVAKSEVEENDLFDAWIWVNGKWEFEGTRKFKVDLSDYQKKTDENLKTTSKEVVGAINEVDSGLVRGIDSSIAEETNVLTIELKDKSGKVIATTQVAIPKSETPDLSAYVKNEDRDSFVQQGIVNNFLQNTDEEKASACEWLGAFKDVPIGREIDNVLAWSVKKGWHTAIVDASNGLALLASGKLVVSTASNAQITSRTTSKPLSADKIDLAVLEALTNPKIEWTDEQKAKARAMLGIE